jgi:hypothetical protein
LLPTSNNRELSLAVETASGIEIGALMPSEAEQASSLFGGIVAALPYYNAAAKKAEISNKASAISSSSIAEDSEIQTLYSSRATAERSLALA